jgi:hypothetical protein
MSTIEDKENDRRALAEKIAQFLSKGGKIREIDPGVSNDVIDYWGETNREDDDDSFKNRRLDG